MCALGPQPGRVGEERLLIRARLRMSGQADERAPDELDAVVPTAGSSLSRPPMQPPSLNAPAE